MNISSILAAIGLMALVPGLAAAASAPPLPQQRTETSGTLGTASSSRAKNVPGKSSAERFGDWTKDCEHLKGETQARCYIYETIDLNKSNQPIVRAVIGHLADDPQQTVLILTVPLGVYLPWGLQIEVPKYLKPQKQQYLTCDNNGCRVVVTVTPNMATALRRGSEAKITIHDTSGRAMAIPLSLKGVSAGLDAL